MATYIYREDCGEFEARFEAADDDAAVAHAEKTWRDPSDPDFDGDSARILRLDWDDEDLCWLEAGVFSFDCEAEDPIEDVNQMRFR